MVPQNRSRAPDAEELLKAARGVLAWARDNRLLQRAATPAIQADRQTLGGVAQAFGAAADMFRTKPISAVGINRVRERIIVYTARALTKAERGGMPNELSGGQEIEYAVAPLAAVIPAVALPTEPEVLGGVLYSCGNSIGVANKRDAGTLGCLVRDDRGALFGLSNHHVTADCGQAQPELPILAPGVLDVAARGVVPFTIGFHAKAPPIVVGNPSSIDVSRNIDAALFRVADPGRISSWQGKHYDTPPEAIEPLEEMTVEKVGRTTGLTRGVIESLIFDSLPVTYDIKAYHSATEEQPFKATVYYVGLFLVRGMEGFFAQPGDSGALVTMVDEQARHRAAVGLILGGTAGDRCYMMAMKPILDQFGVSLVSNHGPPV